MPQQSQPEHEIASAVPHSLPPNIVVHRDMAYVKNGHARQILDLYLPDKPASENLPDNTPTPLPLIIWIHGGAFRLGSKEGTEENPPPFDYVLQGYAVASINYRLSQHAIFPAQIEDCKAAVRWLRVHADEYNIDSKRFAAWGPSAGGHLATMLGTADHMNKFDVGEHLEISSRVQCVVNYFGPTDFLQMDDQRLQDDMIHNDAGSPESELVGGPIQEHPERVAAANPITYITKDVPPMLIVHGDQDPLVPYGQSLILVEALEKIGADATFYTVKGGGHGQFSDPKVSQLSQRFLKKHLRPTTKLGR